MNSKSMNTHHYISKSFIIKTGLLDLSEDQIKRNIKRIAAKEQQEKEQLEREIKLGEREAWEIGYFVPTVFLRRNKNGVKEWHVNYSKIDKIGRTRKPKTNSINTVQKRIETSKRKLINYSNTPPKVAFYTTEISLNFKETYHAAYYEEVAKELFVRYQKNLYFVTEKDREGFVHLHIGCEGNKKEIMIIMNHIVENVLGRFDDTYIKFLEGDYYNSDLHVSDIRSDQAYQKYLIKGDDGLGGASIKFFNV